MKISEHFHLQTLLSLTVAALVALVLLGSSSAAQGQTVTRGPYLQLGTPGSMVIIWRTDSPTNSRVTYGSSASTLDQSVTVAASVTQHEVTVSGLQPNSVYFYAVGSTTKVLAGNTAEHYFRTSPVAGSATKVRIWVAGDTRPGATTGTAAQVMESMLAFSGAAPPRLFLHTGDMVDKGDDPEFQSMFFSPYQKILRNTVCWPCLGNHDTNGSPMPPYFQVYALPKAGQAGGLSSGTESYYSFDHANVHVVVLNSQSEDRAPGKPMLTWLKNDLAATNQTWIIAYWHHPPYAKWGHDSDDKTNEMPMVEMRENALPLLEAAGVDLVFTGHSHYYSRTALVAGAHETPTPTNVTSKLVDAGDGKLLGSGPYLKTTGTAAAVYVVAGHGGTDLHDPPSTKTPPGTNHPLNSFPVGNDARRQHGSCVVTVDRNVLSLVNLTVDGLVSDRFTMVKGQALVLASPDGGERYLPGQQVPIRWSTVGTTSAQVKLELSIDGGGSWSAIAGPLNNSGSHNWTVPTTITERALVRVTSTSDAKLTDDSDGLFFIGAPQRPVLHGANWRYSDNGTDHQSAWLTASFDHSSWNSGPTQLGYGDKDEQTTLANPDPKHPSVYFRKLVTLPAAVQSAWLSVVHDDGVVVWVNGTKVMSKYVTNTNYSAWASQGSQDNELSTQQLSGASVKALKPGSNVLAVMIKQVNGSSSDLSFDLALSVTYLKQKPQFSATAQKQVAEGQQLSFTVQASHPAGNPLNYWAGKLPSGATFNAAGRLFTWTPASGTAGSYQVTFGATDAVGQQASQTVTIKVTAGTGPGDGGGDGTGGDAVSPGPKTENCSDCQTGSGDGSWLWLILLGLALWMRRNSRWSALQDG